MIIEERYFKEPREGVFIYSAHMTDNHKTWFVQARIEKIDGPIERYKIAKFECKLAKPEGARPCEKVGIEHKGQMLDLILEQARQLCRNERNILKHPFHVPAKIEA